MGKRAKLAFPRHIKLAFNFLTGFYEVTENGVLYQLTFAQMNDLKIYCSVYHGSLIPTIETWYNNLTSYSRKTVKRIGVKIENDGFYPDESSHSEM